MQVTPGVLFQLWPEIEIYQNSVEKHPSLTPEPPVDLPSSSPSGLVKTPSRKRFNISVPSSWQFLVNYRHHLFRGYWLYRYGTVIKVTHCSQLPSYFLANGISFSTYLLRSVGC